MRVEVRVFAYFREGREKIQWVTLDEGDTALCVLHALKIKEEDVSILLINGRDGGSERILHEGDILAIFPPVGGG